MFKLCVFAGTTEGRKLLEFLCRQQLRVFASVATEYGETLLPKSDNIKVSARRMTEQEMTGLFRAERFDLVIDATHPYADKVTESVFAACRESDTEYLRLLRGSSPENEGVMCVETIEKAVKLLNITDENILLTTGSKQLGEFAAINGFAKRVYARVLPVAESLSACEKWGLSPAHIIAAQGPFPEEMNLALINFVSAKWLVTKDGGKAGGFDEKLSAAKKAGTKVIVIGRPPQREGYSFSQVIKLLCERFGCRIEQGVCIVGVGTGGRAMLTQAAADTLSSADCIIGAKRLIEEWRDSKKAVFEAVSPEKIVSIIKEHPEYERFAIAMSGDTGFFSGTKRLLPLLGEYDVQISPGISSLCYLCSKLKTSYEDIFVASLHGRNDDVIPLIRENQRVFLLLGSENTADSLCRSLKTAGMGDVRVTVGERLGYHDERITVSTAKSLGENSFSSLSVALIENENADKAAYHGIGDNFFVRGEGEKGIIPMTKSEVRAVCLSKLRLTERSICWDIGAGTGSVSVEMALAAKKGEVYAIEREKSAIELVNANKSRFSIANITIIEGSAPEICKNLPAPTHAFIGGSSGNIREVISLLMRKNPAVRIVATAVSLQAISALTACLKEFSFAETEVASLAVSRGKRLGEYDLMTANNTVYIFTMQGGGEKS